MCLDSFEPKWNREEISQICRRVLESPTPDQERDFYRFFERVRKATEMYSLFMFRGIKLVSFDPKGKYAVIKDQDGREIKINLT